MPRVEFQPAYTARVRATQPWALAVATRYDFAIGHPDPEHFPIEELAAATRRVLERERGRMALYPSEDVHLPTRTLVSRKYALEEGLETRVPQMRDVYRAKRDAMLDALQTHLGGVAEWSRPRGGLFVWVRLPEGFDSVASLPAVRRAGVDYLPGPNFSPSGQGANCLRLSFAYLSTDEIRDGVAILSDALT